MFQYRLAITTALLIALSCLAGDALAQDGLLYRARFGHHDRIPGAGCYGPVDQFPGAAPPACCGCRATGGQERIQDAYMRFIYWGGFWPGPRPIGNGYYTPPVNFPYRHWQQVYLDIPVH